jgi:hypothetical protein
VALAYRVGLELPDKPKPLDGMFMILPQGCEIDKWEPREATETRQSRKRKPGWLIPAAPVLALESLNLAWNRRRRNSRSPTPSSSRSAPASTTPRPRA